MLPRVSLVVFAVVLYVQSVLFSLAVSVMLINIGIYWISAPAKPSNHPQRVMTDGYLRRQEEEEINDAAKGESFDTLL